MNFLNSQVDSSILVKRSTLFHGESILDKEKPEKCLGEDTKILLNSSRKKFICDIVENLKFFLNKQKHCARRLISGLSGIGKTFTLLLLVHFLKNFNFSDDNMPTLKVIMIPNCRFLSEFLWGYVIDQFKFTFPEKSQTFEELKFQTDENIKAGLWKFVYEYVSEGNMIILVADQIDWVSGLGEGILDYLKSFPWTMQVFSESGNNDLKAQEKYVLWKKDFMREIVLNKDELLEIMKNEESSIDIFLKEKLSKTSLLVGFNPRETGYILNLEGETIEKKINKYIGQKLLSIGNRLEKFLLELGSESARNKFYQSVIFMEEKDPIFHIFTLQPAIDVS